MLPMKWLDRLWKSVAEALFEGKPGGDAGMADMRRSAQATAPVVWLLGKTGAGKTAIVAALTGDTLAKIGPGYEPCTRSAAFYDVPRDVPLLRFLDTRGLGESGYDPAEDISWCEGRSHLLLAVMRLGDPTQEAIVDVLREVRRRHPDWPLIVAQTWLHQLYAPGAKRHPAPYPFTGTAGDLAQEALPHPLRQAMAHQRGLFTRLPGAAPRFVPLDFTRPEDALPPAEYGIEALWQALEAAGPEAFQALHQARADADSDTLRARARPLIWGFAAAAAGAGAMPVPLIGAGGLAGTLALMLRALATRYGMAWTPGTLAQFAGAVGGGALVWWGLRYGLTEALKLIPGLGSLAGGALNAAAGFALCVGMGEAACIWLGFQRRGQVAPDEAVRRAFAAGLAEGFRHRKRPASGANPGIPPGVAPRVGPRLPPA